MSLIKLFVLFACAAALAWAAGETPDAKALVTNSGKAMFALGTFRSEMQTNLEMQGGGMSNKMSMVMKMAAMPGKFRMDMSPTGMVILSDGKFTYVSIPMLNQYLKRPAVSSPEGMAEAFMPGGGSMSEKVKEALTSAKILREEAVEIQGHKVDCYVVESTVGKMTAPGAASVTVENTHQITWIGKERGLVLKQIADAEMRMGDATSPMKMHTEMTVTALDLAPTFQPDEFTFVPPAGAKEVDSLPGMPNAAGQN